MCCIQLFSGLTSFRSTSIKPYFWSKNTHNTKLNELEISAKLDKLKAPIKLDELEAPAKLDKLEVPLPTLEVS
jgi:hypothetical protein